MSIRGTVTLITGGSGALAGHIAEAFASAGSRIVLVDRGAAKDRAAALGGLALSADLLDAESAESSVQAALAWGGRLDHVIHTVGGFHWGPAWDASSADYDRMFDLNMRTLFHIGRAALPVLRESGAGLLAGVAAGQAWKGGAADVALYAASKAAVATWLRSVDDELEGTDVKVSVLFPMGAIDTPANRAAMPDGDPDTWIDPADLASALLLAASASRRGRLREIPVYPGRARNSSTLNDLIRR